MRRQSTHYVADDFIAGYRAFDAEKAKKNYPTDPNLERDLQPGWLVSYLLPIEEMIWGRWEYWMKIQIEGALPAEPIPEISFIGQGDTDGKAAIKMLERCIKAVGGGGWSLGQSIEYILDWALFGFGYHQELPPQPCAGASMKLYQLFDLWPLLIWPYDYLGDMMAEAGVGKGQSFYPTPHTLVEMMTKMTMGEGDHRAETVNDCCCGTGRMLLHASNHSLRLYAQDISALAVKSTVFHGYLYAPWLVKPFEWDQQNRIVQSDYARQWSRIVRLEQVLSKCVVRESPPQVEGNDSGVAAPFESEEPETPVSRNAAQTTLFDADFVVERDAQQRPSLKRRKKTAPIGEQLNLLEI